MKHSPKQIRKATATREVLVARFPQCFMPKGQPKRPLAIGIREALGERCPDIAKTRLDLAVADYVAGPSYLSAVAQGVPRIDLDGNPTAPPTEKSIRYALRVLAKCSAESQVRWFGSIVPVESGTSACPIKSAGVGIENPDAVASCSGRDPVKSVEARKPDAQNL